MKTKLSSEAPLSIQIDTDWNDVVIQSGGDITTPDDEF